MPTDMQEPMMEWAKKLSDAEWAAALAGGDSRAPPPPPEAVQKMFVGASGIEAFQHSQIFWSQTKRRFAECGGILNADTRVLDIGVGWGRNYRWMLRDIPASNLIGVDVDPNAVQMCKMAMPYGNFLTVSPGQDYPARNNGYDIAIAYSVFSHLSEGAARSVLATARKALKPNAIFALTTFRPAHIDVWSQQTSAPFYGDLLAAAHFHRLEWWERATDGQHLFLQTGGGDPSRPAESYGEAVVPKGWWEHAEGYRLVVFERRSDMPQSYIVLQRI